MEEAVVNKKTGTRLSEYQSGYVRIDMGMRIDLLSANNIWFLQRQIFLENEAKTAFRFSAFRACGPI